MLTQNKDVINGQANGSRVRTKEVHVKPGETPFTLLLNNGTKVRALFASQVESILVEHEDKSVSPQQFQVACEPHLFVTKLKIWHKESLQELHGGLKSAVLWAGLGISR